MKKTSDTAILTTGWDLRKKVLEPTTTSLISLISLKGIQRKTPRGQIYFIVPSIFKNKNPGVFQKLIDYTHHSYVLTHSNDPWNQTTNSSDNHFYFYPSLTGFIKFIDQRMIGYIIQF